MIAGNGGVSRIFAAGGIDLQKLIA